MELGHRATKENPLLRTLLETTNEAVTIVDATGIVTHWNHAAQALYGISPDEILGKHISDFGWNSLMIARMFEDGQPIRQSYHEPRPGIHVLVNTAPIISDGTTIGVISAEQDITRLVRLGDELYSTTEQLRHLEAEVTRYAPTDDPFQQIRGNSPAISSAIQVAKRVANTNATVLITGESGVGKERFAHAIHLASPRAKQKFVAINCGAIPIALFESELFGYQAGAFTGASRTGKAGKLEVANGGTLFLDEVGELTLDMQVKLLRVLQERQLYRVGGTTPIDVDVRVLAATNRRLEELIAVGKFRDDLYYRLNVVGLEIPSLRERIEDIPELIHLFTREISMQYQKPTPQYDAEVIVALMNYNWPGNIRQLRNVIERLVILSDSEFIHRDALPATIQTPRIHDSTLHHSSTSNEARQPRLNRRDDETEIGKLQAALRSTFGNKTLAAQALGISRGTLYNKMRKYGLQGYY